MYCARYLGDLDAQLLRAQGLLQKPTEFIANTRLRCSSSKHSSDCSIIMCHRKGCNYGYCSEECRSNDDISNGHWLICAGGNREDSDLTRGFLRHASRTNDLFTAGLVVVAKLISIVIAVVHSDCDAHRTAKTHTDKLIDATKDDCGIIYSLRSREHIYGILKVVVDSFESQFPSKNPFWGPRLLKTVKLKTDVNTDAVEKDRNTTGGKSSRMDDNYDHEDRSMKKQCRQIDREIEIEVRDSSIVEDDEDGGKNANENNPDSVSDILEQQAVESWTLLQLLLKYEKKFVSERCKTNPSSHDVTCSARTVHVSADTFNISSDTPVENTDQNLDQSLCEKEDQSTLSIVVESMADVLNFHRWSLLLGSLHIHLVLLQIENPLAAVARSLPNLPNIEDRKEVFQAFESFLGNSSSVSDVCKKHKDGKYGKIGQISKVCVLGNFPLNSYDSYNDRNINGDGNNGSNGSNGNDVSTCISGTSLLIDEIKVSNRNSKSKLHELMLTERKIVRLAQAASLLPTSSSSSSSSVYDEDCSSIPSENPFSAVGFLAMALVPVIGTNLGPARDFSFGYQIKGDRGGDREGAKDRGGHKEGDREGDREGWREGGREGEGKRDREGDREGDKECEGQVESECMGGLGIKDDVRDERKTYYQRLLDKRETQRIWDLNSRHATFVSHSCLPNALLQGHMPDYKSRDVTKGNNINMYGNGDNKLKDSDEIDRFSISRGENETCSRGGDKERNRKENNQHESIHSNGNITKTNGLKARLVALRHVDNGEMILCSAISHSNQVNK